MNKPINYYDKIPKHFLTKTENPNHDLTKIQIPARMVVAAPSGCGKTSAYCDWIHKWCSGKGTFQKIYIIVRSSDEPLLKYLESKSNRIIVSEGIESIPPLSQFNASDGNTLVIFDDLVLEKQQKAISEYFMKARKKNVSCIYCSQSFHMTPSFIRKNATHLVIMRLGSKRETNMILNDYGLNCEKQQLINMYNYCTKDKFNYMTIDLTSSPEERFRHNLLEILDPNDF